MKLFIFPVNLSHLWYQLNKTDNNYVSGSKTAVFWILTQLPGYFSKIYFSYKTENTDKIVKIFCISIICDSEIKIGNIEKNTIGYFLTQYL